MKNLVHAGIEAKENVEIQVLGNRHAHKIRDLFIDANNYGQGNNRENELAEIDKINELMNKLAKDAFRFGVEYAKEKYETKGQNV